MKASSSPFEFLPFVASAIDSRLRAMTGRLVAGMVAWSHPGDERDSAEHLRRRHLFAASTVRNGPPSRWTTSCPCSPHEQGLG